jgi:hypothetical protein
VSGDVRPAAVLQIPAETGIYKIYPLCADCRAVSFDRLPLLFAYPLMLIKKRARLLQIILLLSILPFIFSGWNYSRFSAFLFTDYSPGFLITESK